MPRAARKPKGLDALAFRADDESSSGQVGQDAFALLPEVELARLRPGHLRDDDRGASCRARGLLGAASREAALKLTRIPVIAKRSDGWIARVAFRGQNTQGPREYGSQVARPPSLGISFKWSPELAHRRKREEGGALVAHLLYRLLRRK